MHVKKASDYDANYRSMHDRQAEAPLLKLVYIVQMFVHICLDVGNGSTH